VLPKTLSLFQGDHLEKVHETAVKYDNKTEHLYSFLQVITASLNSFAHGSNDVANAVGPLAAIYSIWNSAQVPGAKTPVDIWILAFCGVGIDIGLVTYGYNVMRSLGNNITFHSPSRGFSMELGTSLTVLTASKIGLPVSTTHCITGATTAVGLCNGNIHAVNWRMIAWCFFSWVLTVPVAGGIAGLIFAFVANAPKLV
jgi:phosphate/sulfate permease